MRVLLEKEQKNPKITVNIATIYELWAIPPESAYKRITN
jgi:hypothetical protein